MTKKEFQLDKGGKLTDPEPAAPVEEVTVDAKPSTPVAPVAGRPFPEGFKNPPCGEPGHKCKDPSKKYRPDWYQVYIHTGPEIDTTIPVLGHQSETYTVPTGKWVDAPPEVVTVLGRCRRDIYKPQTGADGRSLGIAGRMEVIGHKPRFQYSVVPSA